MSAAAESDRGLELRADAKFRADALEEIDAARAEVSEARIREIVREEIGAVVARQAAAAQASLDEALSRMGRALPKTPRIGGDGAPVPRLAEARRAGQETGEEVTGDQ